MHLEGACSGVVEVWFRHFSGETEENYSVSVEIGTKNLSIKRLEHYR